MKKLKLPTCSKWIIEMEPIVLYNRYDYLESAKITTGREDRSRIRKSERKNKGKRKYGYK